MVPFVPASVESRLVAATVLSRWRGALRVTVVCKATLGFAPDAEMTLAPPVEIVAHRIIWSLLFLAALVGLWRRWPEVRRAMSSLKVVGILFVTAALIAANWLIYVWAVVNGHVLEASLGYYLNPLFNVLLGVLLLRERLSRAQAAAVYVGVR